jgi:hypothetical protein
VADKVDFEAPAELRKWISLRNERVSGVANSPYLVVAGTLSECITRFVEKPVSQHHLYEIYTKAPPPLVTNVLQGDHIIELARLRDFL